MTYSLANMYLFDTNIFSESTINIMTVLARGGQSADYLQTPVTRLWLRSRLWLKPCQSYLSCITSASPRQWRVCLGSEKKLTYRAT